MPSLERSTYFTFTYNDLPGNFTSLQRSHPQKEVYRVRKSSRHKFRTHTFSTATGKAVPLAAINKMAIIWKYS